MTHDSIPAGRFAALIFLSTCLSVEPAVAEGGVFDEPITVTGKAIGMDGKPIAGAQIYLASVRNDQKLIAETKTDEKGEYSFINVKLPVLQPKRAGQSASGVFEVFGQAKGYGFAWRGQRWFYPDGVPDFGNRGGEERRFGPEKPIVQDLHFDEPAPLSGLIMDENDKPIANASVVLFNAEPVSDSGFDTAQEFLVVQDDAFTALYLSKVTPGEMRRTFTDETGRFVFSQAPKNTGFRIFVKAAGFANRGLFASTAAKKKFRFGDDDLKIHRDGMKLVFQGVKRCPVSVLYGDTGKPAKNVMVELGNKLANHSGVTNADGKAELRLPPGEYRVSYLTEFGTAYISRHSRDSIMNHTIPIGDAEAELVIRLEAAGRVEIEVVDAHIGRPIKGADVSVAEGDFKRDYMWRSWKPPNISMVDRPRSDEDGKMTVFLKPGTYTIEAGNEHTPLKYTSAGSAQEITIKASETKSLQLKMKRRGVR